MIFEWIFDVLTGSKKEKHEVFLSPPCDRSDGTYVMLAIDWKTYALTSTARKMQEFQERKGDVKFPTPEETRQLAIKTGKVFSESDQRVRRWSFKLCDSQIESIVTNAYDDTVAELEELGFHVVT